MLAYGCHGNAVYLGRGDGVETWVGVFTNSWTTDNISLEPRIITIINTCYDIDNTAPNTYFSSIIMYKFRTDEN